MLWQRWDRLQERLLWASVSHRPSTYSPKQLFPSTRIRPEPQPRRQEEKALQSDIVTKTIDPMCD